MASTTRIRLAFVLLFGSLLSVSLLAAWTFHKAEMSQHEAEVLSSAILKSDVAFAAINRDGTITKWSSGAEKLFGYSKKEAIGENIDIIIPEDMRQAHNDKFAEAISAPNPQLVNQIDCYAQTKSNQRVRVIARTRLYPGTRFAAVSTFEREADVKRINAVKD